MANQNADETVTVRLPRGAAAKLKAASGQPFSRLVRFMVMAMLAKYEAEGKLGVSAKAELQADVVDVVNSAELPK